MRTLIAGVLMFGSVVVVFAYGTDSDPAKGPKALNYKETLGSIEYPTECRSMGIEGTVVARLKISNKGEVLKVSIVSTPHKELGKACKDRLRKLKFDPNTLKQKKNNKHRIVDLPIHFVLDI